MKEEVKQKEEIPEQNSIIGEKKVNMIVSASAGSGKTFVMIERILKILLSKDKEVHANLDEMLILTFTNQAANEMSQRLETKLMEKVDENPELVEQLDLIRVCDISTIHAFCQKMLKKYFYEAKISADFELVSEEKQRMMINKAITRAVLQFKSQNSQDYEELLQFFSTKRNDKDIISAAMQINSLLENQTDADLWIKNISTFLYSQEGRKAYEEYFNGGINSFAKYYKGIFADYINRASDEKIKLNLRKTYDMLDEVRDSQNFEKNRQVLLSMRMPALSCKNQDEFSLEVISFREKFKDKLKNIRDKMKIFGLENEDELRDRSKNIIDSLLWVYEQGKKLYDNQKQKKKPFGFFRP